MAKLFNKKIKTRFPILFKWELDFHLMKAREGYKESGSISCEKFSVRELGSVFTVIE